MGSPKAWLQFDGEPLLCHLAARLRTLVSEIVVVAADPEQDLPDIDARRTADLRPQAGPLAGIEAGLQAATADHLLVVSCDVPFFSPEVGRLVLQELEASPMVLPVWAGRDHPLQAGYRRELLPMVTELLDSGRRRPLDLLERCRGTRLEESQLRSVDPEGESFFNMNQPEDYQDAMTRWALRAGRA